MKTILVIDGHKPYSYSPGKLNETLFNAIVDWLDGKAIVKTNVVNNGYDVKGEQAKFMDAEIVIVQTPINWMNIPFVLKEYIDQVFEHGIFFGGSDEYGKGGKLIGKKYMLSTTWHARLSDFNNIDGFFNGRSEDDMLIPVHKSFEFIGMTGLNSFFCHDVLRNPQIDLFLDNLGKHLETYLPL